MPKKRPIDPLDIKNAVKDGQLEFFLKKDHFSGTVVILCKDIGGDTVTVGEFDEEEAIK